MSFLTDKSEAYLYYLFRRRVLEVGSKVKTVTEVGQQALKVTDVSIRPLRPDQSLFILTVCKDKTEDEQYVPIRVEYTVTMVGGKPDIEGQRLSNFSYMAFGHHLDYGGNLIAVYEQLAKHKNKYFNALIRHKVKLKQDGNGKPVYDDDPTICAHVSRMLFLNTHLAYIQKVRQVDHKFLPIDIDWYNLIDDYDERDRSIINNYLHINE